VTDDTGPPPPTRREVSRVFEDLAAGKLSPEEAADWTMPWITAGSPGVSDEGVWQALVTLSGADLRTGPNTYLHGPDDFRLWLSDFVRSTSGRPSMPPG
jgi:hypothetical protein